MNYCQRPKAESNSSSEMPKDHLLPENPENNCFVIPHFLELCSMMNGQAPDKMIHYTTQKHNTFVFFLPLMNHFSRKYTNAIAYKITDFFLAYDPRSSSSHTDSTVSKSFSNDAYFRHARGRFFFADLEIASRHSFGIFYAVLIPFLVRTLSLPIFIDFLFKSVGNPLPGVCNNHLHL